MQARDSTLLDLGYWSRQSLSFVCQYQDWRARKRDQKVDGFRKRGLDDSGYDSMGMKRDGEVPHPQARDLHGPDLTITDGVRRTICPDIPRDATRVEDVVVLGGSTVECAEVSDQFTLPSQLATRLGALGVHSHVTNLGESGATTPS
jgi:hypothetical protein